jgi:hypothetical protein
VKKFLVTAKQRFILLFRCGGDGILAALVLLALAACSSGPPAPPVPPKDAPEWPANAPPLEPQTNDLIHRPTTWDHT